MIILPYSTALTLAQPPKATYATVLICVLVFYLQLSTSISEQLLYYPESWNPLTMISSSFAHADIFHLLGNLLFFMAFAPAVEAVIASRLHYVGIILFLSVVVSICYSLSIIIGGAEPLPSLGLSGVVMGFIGLSAFLMPQARIRVFWWYIVFWKTFYIPGWIVAAFFIGLDTWEMLTAENYHGINVVAHVAGGIAGYLYGYFWMQDRKSDIKEELEDEIEEMKIEQRHGKSHSMSYRGRKRMDEELVAKKQQQVDDRFMGQVYKAVTTHRDAEAINLLVDRYDYKELGSKDFITLYKHIEAWGPSRTLLCLGRLIIFLLDRENRYGQALHYIEKCQAISPAFILPDLTKTHYYAKMAIDAGRPEITSKLIKNSEKRYGHLVDLEQLKTLEPFISAV